MQVSGARKLAACAVAVALAQAVSLVPVRADIVLFDAATVSAKDVRAQDGATFVLTNGLLTVTTKPSERYPGFCIAGKWDLSGCRRIEVEFVNGGIRGQYTLRLLRRHRRQPCSMQPER